MSYGSNVSRNQAGPGGGRGHEAGGPAVGKRTLVEAQAPVQRARVPAASPAAAGQGGGSVQEAAAHGTSGAAGALPYLGAIQASFGRHDVSGIQAHTDAPAAAGAKAMGAEAFATGDHVAFGGSPSLFTAAHEAAHVVQQRAGVQLSGGVGQEGDPYEQHADAVASLVVQGKSAEALLDQHAPGGGGGAGVQRSTGPVQMVRVQRSNTGEFVETNDLLDRPEELVALALEFFNLHNMDQLALIQQAHHAHLRGLGYNISNESLEMLSAPVHDTGTSGGKSGEKEPKGKEVEKGGGGGFRKIPLREGLIHGTYDEETNSIDLHVEAKGSGGSGTGLPARAMLAIAERCHELMTARERNDGPQGRFMLHPTGAVIVKIMVELLGGALGSRLDKWKAAALQLKRKKLDGPGGPKNPDKLEQGVLPEHFAFLDSLRSNHPSVSIVPRLRGKYNTEENVDQNMMEKTPQGNERYETYKTVLQSSDDEEPIGPGLDVTLTSDLLPAVIATLRSRV